LTEVLERVTSISLGKRKGKNPAQEKEGREKGDWVYFGREKKEKKKLERKGKPHHDHASLRR